MSIACQIAVFISGLYILAGPLHAKGRSCRIVYPERPQGAPKMAYIFEGTKSYSVTLPSMNLSEVIEFQGGELTVAMLPNEINDPKLLPPNPPMLKIPETVTDFYIIIIPDPDNLVLPVKMKLVDTGGGKLKPGETLWYNFTENLIAAKLGDSKMSVNAFDRTISKDPLPASGYYVARFAYQAKGQNEFAPITEQSWWHDANNRHLGFIVDSGGKLPKIYFYRDFRDPEQSDSKEQNKTKEP